MVILMCFSGWWMARSKASMMSSSTMTFESKGFRRGSHFVLMTAADPEAARRWLGERDGALRIMSVGEAIEIYKEKGLPKAVAARFGLDQITGTHAIGRPFSL